MERAGPPAPNNGETNILCVGDSFTFGMGAAVGYSYPAQLQKMLDADGRRSFKVYNCGFSGWTSGKLASYLPGFLSRYRPNVVVLLIGASDRSGSDLALPAVPSSGGKRRLEARLDEMLVAIAAIKSATVIQTYPYVFSDENVNAILREVAQKHGVALIDQQKAFQELPGVAKGIFQFLTSAVFSASSRAKS
jgi:lysophospholipase L1-like esterase